jgi:type I restriction enzyme S subunit
MAGKWRETTLGQLTDFLSGGTPSKDVPEYWGGSVPWVSAKDMKRFRLDNTEDHVTADGIANGTKLIPEGTVLLLVRGMTLLNDLPICVTGRPMTFNQDVKALRPKAGVQSDFLSYLLLGNKERLLGLVDLAGHGTGRLNSDELKALDVMLPPEPEQHAIARILATLDDKIDLNRRTNETLESIARTIFKSWFVDCDPMRAKVEGQGRPSMGTVDSVVGIRREGINPGEFSNELFDHYSIPAFDERRMPRQESGESIKSNKFVVPPQTVLLSKLNPRFPRIWLPEVSPIRRSVCSTEFIVAEPKPGFSREFVYCLFGSSGFAESLSELVTGTSSSHQRVRPEDFLRMKVIRPPQELVARFTEAVRPMLKHTAEGAEESLTLSFLRNALLPKLLSGELRIRDAEKMVEAHV